MAITRVWQAGAELNKVLLEFTSRSSYSQFVISATAPHTGTYSFRIISYIEATKVFATTYTQMRTGFYFRHTGAGTNDAPGIVGFKTVESLLQKYAGILRRIKLTCMWVES